MAVRPVRGVGRDKDGDANVAERFGMEGEGVIEPHPHPAKFHDLAISRAAEILADRSLVLDPFAGTGRCHELATADRRVVGVEIEPEWAGMHPNTITGDSRLLRRLLIAEIPEYVGKFDAVFTSPTYGNRMADKHNAKDASQRITYKHKLGRDLDPNNGGGMQWGPAYRNLHRLVWISTTSVCAEARGVFNIKNHIRAGEEMPVVEWHIETLEKLGWKLAWKETIDTPGMRRGQNHELRVNDDYLIVMDLEKG